VCEERGNEGKRSFPVRGKGGLAEMQEGKKGSDQAERGKANRRNKSGVVGRIRWEGEHWAVEWRDGTNTPNKEPRGKTSTGRKERVSVTARESFRNIGERKGNGCGEELWGTCPSTSKAEKTEGKEGGGGESRPTTDDRRKGTKKKGGSHEGGETRAVTLLEGGGGNNFKPTERTSPLFLIREDRPPDRHDITKIKGKDGVLVIRPNAGLSPSGRIVGKTF